MSAAPTFHLKYWQYRNTDGALIEFVLPYTAKAAEMTFILPCAAHATFPQLEKIPLRASSEQQMQVLSQLAEKAAPRVANDAELLWLVLEMLRAYDLPMPDWVFNALEDLMVDKLTISQRDNAKMRNMFIDEIRWAVVLHTRASTDCSWEQSFGEVAEALAETPAGGSDETIRASYKRFQRTPLVRAMTPDERIEKARTLFKQLATHLRMVG